MPAHLRPVFWLILPILLLSSGALSVPSAASSANPTEPKRALLSGPQPFVTVLCKFRDMAAEPRPVAYFEDLVGKPGSELDRYWREVSYDQINLAGSKVAGWFTMPGSVEAYRADTTFGVDLDRLAQDCAAAADPEVFFPDYAGINFMFNFPATSRSGGMKSCLTLDGQSKCYGLTWLWPGAASEEAIVAHEMGHAFGWQHSSSGRGFEYANPWDVMSGDGACGRDPVYGTQPQHVIAYNKDVLGWIPPERKFVAPGRGALTVTLEQLARPGPGGYLMAQVPIGGTASHFYTVEARRRVGYDASLPGDAVVIHEIDSSHPLPAHLVNRLGDDDTRVFAGMWTVGTVFRDLPHGISVSVDSQTATGFVVTIATDYLPVRSKTTAAVDRYPASRVIARTATADQVAPAIAAGPDQDVQVLWLEQSGAGSAPAVQSASFVPTKETANDPWAWTGQVNDGPTVTRFAIPSLAVGSRGDVYAVWQNPSTTLDMVPANNVDIWFAHKPAQGGWESSVKINDGEARTLRGHPVIAADRRGNVYALWGENRSDHSDIYFAYQPVGDRWGPNVRVNRDKTNTARWSADFAVDGQGNGEAVWTENHHGRTEIHAAYRPDGLEWEDDVPIDPDGTSNQMSPAVAMDGLGKAYAIWQSFDGCGGNALMADIMFAAKPVGGAWETAVRVANDIGSVNIGDHDIAADEVGNVYVVWEEQVGANFELFVMHRSPSGANDAAADSNGWEPKVRVGSIARDAAPAQPAITVDGAGRAYVAWVDSHEGTKQIRVSEVK